MPMRRGFTVAVLSGLLAIAPAALAQHPGGGHGAAGGHSYGSFAAPHPFSGFSGVGRSFGTGRSFGAVLRMTWTPPRYAMMAPMTSMPVTPGARPAYAPGGESRHWDGHHRRIWGTRGGYRYGYGGYGYGAYGAYPFVNAWELLPGDFDDDDTASQQQQPPAETQPEYVPQSGYSQGGPESGYEPEYRADYAPPPPYQPAAAAAPVRPEPKLTLIFKDGHTEQIQNYILTADTLIDLDEAATGREPQIPLASLNLPATEQAAQQAGLQFAPPAS